MLLAHHTVLNNEDSRKKRSQASNEFFQPMISFPVLSVLCVCKWRKVNAGYVSFAMSSHHVEERSP